MNNSDTLNIKSSTSFWLKLFGLPWLAGGINFLYVSIKIALKTGGASGLHGELAGDRIERRGHGEHDLLIAERTPRMFRIPRALDVLQDQRAGFHR